MARFIDELVQRWRYGGILYRIIGVNVAVFLILRLVAMIVTLSGGNAETSWIQWFELPSAMILLMERPWTLITYMFAQYGILHLAFNMLWLYWFGRFFLFGNTPRQLFALYVYGGIGGAVMYLAAFNLLPYFSGTCGWLLGSSASVLAIVVATAWRMPDYKIQLLFLGDVALKWIAVVAILFSLLNVAGENAGGNIAHIGGALAGMCYGWALGRGLDITRWFNFAIDRVVVLAHMLADRVSGMSTKHMTGPAFGGSRGDDTTRRAAGHGLSAEEEISIDTVLDKIKKSGYASLSADERKRLFEASSKLK